MKQLLAVFFIFTILLSACGASVPKTPPGNDLPSTAAPIPPAETEISVMPGSEIHTLRVEFSTSSDWSKLLLLDPRSILDIRLVDKQGELTNYTADKTHLDVGQTLANAQAQKEITITVDFDVSNNSTAATIPFLLQKGALNTTTIRFYNLLDGKTYSLLDEVIREGSVEGDTDLNSYNFSFDLSSLFQDVAILPAPTTIPTLLLPVSQSTSVPFSSTKINTENVKDLQEIARYYADDIKYIARLTKDNQFLLVGDGDGVDKYDYPSMNRLVHIPIPMTEFYADDFKFQPEGYLQNTNDGNWILINNRWLVDLRNNNQPETRDLSTEFPLKNLYIRTVSLSPDGSLLTISDRRCSDACTWDVAKIVNLSDGSAKEAPALYGFSPAVSSDGRYIAFSTQTSINIWGTSDFEKVSTLKIDSPYSVGNIVFSADSRLVAIGQKTNIMIYDVQTGEVQTMIQGLCDALRRRVMFAPNLPVRLVESSDCGSGVWIIDQGKASGGTSTSFDFSNIKFDEEGSISSIPYPQPTSHSIGYERARYFQFLDHETFVFDGDSNSGFPNNNHSCALSLSENTFKCSDNTQNYVNNQWLGRGQILGTDEQMYDYRIQSSMVEIRSQTNPSQADYSFPWKGYLFDIKAFDPVNQLIFYQIALNANINQEIIQDMSTGEVMEKKEGETFFVPIAFSKNRKYAAICQKLTYVYRPFVDKLMILDLARKAVIFNMDFTCNPRGGSLAFSNDGDKFAAEYVSGFSGETVYVQLLLLDVANDFKIQRLDLGASRVGAVAFTPDGNLLAAMCQDDTICFLNPSDGQELYRLKAHAGITHLAFSSDGALLATSSDWGLISLWAVPPFTSR